MAKKVGEKTEVILQAAKEVFAEVGYHNATISNIAKTAKIGDGTVYIYFKNKEDILTTLFHEAVHNRFVPKVEAAIVYFEDARFQLLELVRIHLKFFGSDYSLARVIQIESRQSSNAIRESMKPGINRYFRLIEKMIERGQQQGVFRADISSRNCRKLIFGGLDEVVTCWVLSSKEYSLIRMVEPTYKLFLQMLTCNFDEPLKKIVDKE